MAGVGFGFNLSRVMSTKFPIFQPADLPDSARIAVVAARFNADVTDELLNGCLRRFGELGIEGSRVEIYRVPGAFELPVAAKMLARTHRFSAIVCLGCIIRGDTPHFEYVAREAARGVQEVALHEMLPTIFGVLTVDNAEQARERIGGKHGHYGERAAESAAEMIALVTRIRR